QGTESLVIIVMNNQLSLYGGDMAIGAMTIMSSVMQIVILPLMGLTQGAQPIISYNFGANKMDRIKKTFKLLLVCCLSYTGIMWTLLMLVPKVFVLIFNSNPELVNITTWSIRIYFAGMILFGAQIACQQTFLALGQAKTSLILALLRKIILLIPLAYILPKLFEDVLSAVITVICFIVFYKKTLSNKMTEDVIE
ncbi:MAG: MATE family efflux transporter, partial [Oscillospiraceae bacterium]